MLKIRLTRVGRKHDPSFRVIVTDSRRASRSGAYLENLGFYNSCQKEVQLKVDRIKFWISKGAQVSGVVHNLFINEGIIKGKKVNVFRTKKKTEEKTEPEKKVDEKKEQHELKKKPEPEQEVESEKKEENKEKK